MFEIRHPKFFDIPSFDDDYAQPIRRLHLFEPFDPPPIVYLPRIHYAPDVYVEEHFPFVYERFEEPAIPPYMSRLLTTLSYTYKAKVLPVRDYVDDNKETSEDSVSSASKILPQADKTTSTPKKDANVKTSTPAQGSVKIPPPKPNTIAEPVTKPVAETKPESGKPTEPIANVEATITNVDEETKPVDEVINDSEVETPDADVAATVTAPESVNDANGQPELEGNDGEATAAEDIPVPAA